MNEFCFIKTKSIHDDNQSAITTTATTIPLYTNNKKEEFINKDIMRHSSINSIAFQFPNFVHLTQSKKKQTLCRRFFFTFICLFVIIFAIILTILLILRFS